MPTVPPVPARGRAFLVVVAIGVTLLTARPAAAQVVASGTTLTVTTANAVATFTGPDLTGLLNTATGETYLKNPSDGTLSSVNAFAASGTWTISNWAVGTEGGTGVPMATITAQDSARSLALSVKIDAASQEIVVRLNGAVTNPGLREVRWSLAGLDLSGGRLIVPAESGVVFDSAHAINPLVTYPNSWNAQMAVYETAQSSVIVYSTDSQYLFKNLRTTTRGETTIDVALGTQAVAPYGTATAVPQVEWRLKAFTGDWRVAAQVYRNWLTVNRAPISNAAHPWVANIRTVVTVRTLDPAILPALAAQVVPSQTVLYLVDWRVDPFGVNFPDYTPRADAAPFVAAARALGFRIMLHTDLLGVAPTNADYASVQAWHVRAPETLQLLGWNWNLSTTVRYAYINLAAPVYRSLYINRIRVAVDALQPDALHLDISAPMMNDGNGLIGGLSFPQGSVLLHQELKAEFPTVVLGGEGENDVIYQFHSLAQAWWLTTINTGHPISHFLFAPQVQYYGHLSQPAARESGFKIHAAELSLRGMLPTLPVTVPGDLDLANPDNARLNGWINAWQSHAFIPDWTGDWSGAVIRYTSPLGPTTAALTDTGTRMTLTAAGNTIFALAHDANQVASPPYVSNWPAFNAGTTFGLDPAKRYFLDLPGAPASTHVAGLPAGVRVGEGSMSSSTFTHVEVLPPAGFDFERGLLTAEPGVRFNGTDSSLGNGAVVEIRTFIAGGQSRRGIFMHPPYLGQFGGETFVEYMLPVPADASLQFDVAIADNNATCTDGVTFKVSVSGANVFQEHIGATGWQHRTVSLAAYGGTTVPVRLINNPGPSGNPGCDSTIWNQVGLVVPVGSMSAPVTLAPGSIYSGFTGSGSLSLAGSTGTVSNLSLPGHFTVFTQPGPMVSIASNVATLPFDIWNAAHGELLTPGRAGLAGIVGALSAGGVVINPAIFAEPPGFGRSVLTWVLRLPATPVRLWWRAGMLDGSASSDGVRFTVAVNGVTRWELTTAATQWFPGNVDLSPWAGQSVLIELTTDSIGSATFDFALWGELVLREGPFTDASLTSGLTTIKRAHITELRERIDSLRVRAGLAVYSWTDVLTAGFSLVRAQHVTELRTALTQAYTALSITPPVYTDPVLAAGVGIRAVHITQLRTAVLALE